ncbi:MAG: DUF4189 domain-containing protein [Synechococcaceae cyanobacterium SM1_2_3]|nr:DUF4189 domain-containing protein [Synechococcaceae cyanobacterium SM1_2_3]
MSILRVLFFAILGVMSWHTASFACYSQCSLECDRSNDASCIPLCVSSCQGMNMDYIEPGSGAKLPDKYGAIAFSHATMNYGISYNFDSRQAAEAAAVNYCANNANKPTDCQVATWFYNHCGALAIKPNSGKGDGAWAAEHAGSRRSAEQKAMLSCARFAGPAAKNCRVVKSFCARQ